jgi:deoxyribonuclease-4
MLFGAHISVSGGYTAALDYALSVGCECAQVFAKSPRQWRGPSIDLSAAEAFARRRAEVGFGPVFTHTAYLVNLSTSNEELWEKSVVALADELRRGGSLGAAGVVTHIGNAPDGDGVAAARRTGVAIRRAFDAAGELGGATRLLLENTAGAGSTFGASFEELGACVDEANLGSDLLGVCLDTCHAFAQGIALTSPQGWDEALAALSASVGLDRLGLIHANDCKFELGSRRDRHEWIGDGHIGTDGFAAMVCAPELVGVPVVTEMPGEAPEKDAINIGRLVSLREQCEPSR